jgi:hypothetical protein
MKQLVALENHSYENYLMFVLCTNLVGDGSELLTMALNSMCGGIKNCPGFWTSHFAFTQYYTKRSYFIN